MKQQDGGPAFPPHWDPKTHDSGMSLRDYFAAKAMAAFNANPNSWHSSTVNDKVIAEMAYRQSDAMLSTRERRTVLAEITTEEALSIEELDDEQRSKFLEVMQPVMSMALRLKLQQVYVPLEQIAVEVSKGLTEHPEFWGHFCQCDSCRSYGDG